MLLTSSEFVKRLFFLILPWLWLSGYSQFYQIRNFNAGNGLPSPEIYGLLQDSKGYMWFATDRGVSRYNGYEFKNLGTENGLPDNTIFGFCEDIKGRIWFRSFSGKLSYFLNDSIYTLSCNSLLDEKIGANSLVLVSMYVDEGDTIWAGTTTKNILKIAPPWREKDVSWIGMPKNEIYLYLINDQHEVFGGGNLNSTLITVYSKQLKKLCAVGSKSTGPTHKYFVSRLRDGTFLASVNSIILKFNKNGILHESDQKCVLITLLEQMDHKIVSTSYEGVRIHDSDNYNKYETIPAFSDKIFTGIVLDHEGSLWLGTEGYGVYHIPFGNNRYYTTEHGLIESKIACMAEKDGTIITGHLNEMVSIIKGDTIKTLKLHSGKAYYTANNRINCIYIHNNTDIYIGSNRSTFKLNKEYTGFEEFINTGSKKLLRDTGSFVWKLSPGRIRWVDISQEFSTKKEVVFNRFASNIYKDKAGVIWICAINGLWNYKKDSLHYLGKENGLLSTRVVDIVEDARGWLWMASLGKGIIIKAGPVFYTIDKAHGLASNMCRNLFIDGDGAIWVGSNNGLSKITPKKGSTFAYEITVYSKKQGLLSNEVNYIIGRGKELVLSHNNGISILRPDLLEKDPVPPPVYITSAEVNNTVYKNDSLRLTYSQSYYKIDYVGLSYKTPGGVEYKYKMEGLDTSWVYTTYTSAQFQALNPGDYKFIVCAKSEGNCWSVKPAVLHICILPVWWQSWAFKAGVFIFLAGLAYTLAKNRLNKIRKRERENAELKNKMTTAELKALRAQMSPHFVFNAINSVQHFIMSNDPDSSQRYLSKFAKLIRYVVDNSKPSAIRLEKELEAITLFLDLEAMRFENKFEYTISIAPALDPVSVHIPSMLIQPYIENSIWHGIMHKKSRGKIDIRFELLDNLIKCTIEDNGIGRKGSQDYKNKNAVETHKSVGMSNTQERLEIINHLNKSKLSIQITDLLDPEGNALGTRVELFIPFY